MTRTLLGVTAMLLGLAAAVAWILDETTVPGVLARVAAILAALWIAWPSLVRVDLRSVVLSTAAVLLLVWRPRSAWIVLPVLAFVLGRPRGRRAAARAGRG